MNPGIALERLSAAVERAVIARAEVAAAYVYGSAARGRTTPLSDVDVGILFGAEIDDRPRRALLSAIAADLAASVPGLDFDVRDVERLPLVVVGRVLTEGIRAGSRDDVRRVRFETDIRQRYFDFLPFHRRDVEEGMRALRRRHLGG